jgi:hypothetical protein
MGRPRAVTGRIAFGLLCALRATLIFGEVSAAQDWHPSWPRLRRLRAPAGRDALSVDYG